MVNPKPSLTKEPAVVVPKKEKSFVDTETNLSPLYRPLLRRFRNFVRVMFGQDRQINLEGDVGWAALAQHIR